MRCPNEAELTRRFPGEPDSMGQCRHATLLYENLPERVWMIMLLKRLIFFYHRLYRKKEKNEWRFVVDFCK